MIAPNPQFDPNKKPAEANTLPWLITTRETLQLTGTIAQELAEALWRDVPMKQNSQKESLEDFDWETAHAGKPSSTLEEEFMDLNAEAHTQYDEIQL